MVLKEFEFSNQDNADGNEEKEININTASIDDMKIGDTIRFRVGNFFQEGEVTKIGDRRKPNPNYVWLKIHGQEIGYDLETEVDSWEIKRIAHVNFTSDNCNISTGKSDHYRQREIQQDREGVLNLRQQNNDEQVNMLITPERKHHNEEIEAAKELELEK